VWKNGNFFPLCLEEAVELYKFDGFSSTVKEWNALRKAAVEMAFKEMLFPQLRYWEQKYFLYVASE
jgi:hypothetical protein